VLLLTLNKDAESIPIAIGTASLVSAEAAMRSGAASLGRCAQFLSACVNGISSSLPALSCNDYG